MTRVHDMGGRFGDGPLDTDESIVFEQDWHARALALTIAAGSLGQWNIDMSRSFRENLSPKDYARFSYYEKWIGGLVDMMVARGVLTAEDIVTGTGKTSPLADRKLVAEKVAAVLAAGGPAMRDGGPAPLFGPGDAVKTRRPSRNILVNGGHTRLPSYASGATGRVLRCHGNHVLPDSNAHALGEAPEPLYAVAFDAAELWGSPERDGDSVVLDLWQSYLEPA